MGKARKQGAVRLVVGIVLMALIGVVSLQVAAMEAGPHVVSGQVSQVGAGPLGGATVTALDPSGTEIADVDTQADGTYSMSLASGTYDFRLTPPAGSSLPTVFQNDVDVTADRQVDFVYAEGGSGLVVTLSGVGS